MAKAGSGRPKTTRRKTTDTATTRKPSPAPAPVVEDDDVMVAEKNGDDDFGSDLIGQPSGEAPRGGIAAEAERF